MEYLVDSSLSLVGEISLMLRQCRKDKKSMFCVLELSRGSSYPLMLPLITNEVDKSNIFICKGKEEELYMKEFQNNQVGSTFCSYKNREEYVQALLCGNVHLKAESRIVTCDLHDVIDCFGEDLDYGKVSTTTLREVPGKNEAGVSESKRGCFGAKRFLDDLLTFCRKEQADNWIYPFLYVVVCPPGTGDAVSEYIGDECVNMITDSDRERYKSIIFKKDFLDFRMEERVVECVKKVIGMRIRGKNVQGSPKVKGDIVIVMPNRDQANSMLHHLDEYADMCTMLGPGFCVGEEGGKEKELPPACSKKRAGRRVVLEKNIRKRKRTLEGGGGGEEEHTAERFLPKKKKIKYEGSNFQADPTLQVPFYKPCTDEVTSCAKREGNKGDNYFCDKIFITWGDWVFYGTDAASASTVIFVPMKEDLSICTLEDLEFFCRSFSGKASECIYFHIMANVQDFPKFTQGYLERRNMKCDVREDVT